MSVYTRKYLAFVLKVAWAPLKVLSNTWSGQLLNELANLKDDSASLPCRQAA